MVEFDPAMFAEEALWLRIMIELFSVPYNYYEHEEGLFIAEEINARKIEATCICKDKDGVKMLKSINTKSIT